MKIHTIKSEYSRDFYATYECEHCGQIEPTKPGYHDTYFHTKVIPAMCCPKCGKNRAGETKEATA